jgi:VIT1/CCC1 family predicted Fe2+/Mn2+ transporter
MAEARKAFKLATLEREELELMNDISNHENQLQTALNDDQRKELKLALKIARLELEINGYKIDLENATTEEERRRKEQHIETKEVLLHDLNAQLEHKQSSGKSI